MPKLQAYKNTWANYTGESQAEAFQRESAVQSAENQLHAEGQRYIDAERERLANRATLVSQSSTDVQNAARAITKACQSRIVDVEEVADQLDELENQARRNREAIARIEEQQDRNEARADNPVLVAEHLYDKYPLLVSPADPTSNGGLLPPFRTDSEQSSPATSPGLNGRTSSPSRTRRGSF